MKISILLNSKGSRACQATHKMAAGTQAAVCEIASMAELPANTLVPTASREHLKGVKELSLPPG